MGCSPHQQEKGELLGCDGTTVLLPPVEKEFSNADSSSGKKFLRNLRTLLLRIRMAGQLRQGFVLEKHFVELKDLCRRVCVELGATATVSENLWAVVQQRRGDAENFHQHSNGPACSLAQDAETVSRAGEILQRAAAARAQDSCAFDVPSSALSSPSFYGGGTNKDEQISARCSPRHGLQLRKDSLNPQQDAVAPPTGAESASFDNPADSVPPLSFAETLGVGNAVDACLDFIANETEAVVAAAKKRFSRSETMDVTSPALPPADWALAVQRLAAWSRKGGEGTIASRLQPTLSLSPTGGNEIQEPSPPSSASPPQGSGCCSRHFCGLCRAASDKRGATAVVERATQCPGDEMEDDGTILNHRTAVRRRTQAPRRNLRCALRRSPPLRSEPQQTPSTTKSTPSSLPPPPPPPPWPRAACVEPTVTYFDDGAADGHVVAWRERSLGDHPVNVVPWATAKACCRQQAAHREAAAPGGCSMRGHMGGDIRDSSSGSNDGVDEQVSFEEDGRDDDRSELSADDIPRDLWNHESKVSGGGEGDDMRERRCCGYMSGDADNGCCRKNEDPMGAFSKSTGKSTSRTMLPGRASTRLAAEAVQPATSKASVRVEKQSPSRHPSERWSFARFESDLSSERHDPNEEPTSQRRWPSHSAGYDDDRDGRSDDGGGDAEAVRPGPRECNIEFSSGAAGVSLRPEDGQEAATGEDGEQDDESSCALARKRALLRVRLARQQHELATAVVDAHERGLRAERRRKREEKLAALLISARRDSSGGDIGYGGCSGNQSARGGQLGRDKCYDTESDERGGEGRRLMGASHRGASGDISRRGVGATSVPSVAPRAKCDGSGVDGSKVAVARFKSADRCRGKGEEEENNDDDDDDDDDAVPRKPLRVFPVLGSNPTVRRSRSGCWGSSQKEREESKEGKSLGGPSRAHPSLPPSLRQAVVWIDALYALEGQRGWFEGRMLSDDDGPCTKGDALYLVLEDRCTRYRTATRRRHRAVGEVGRALRANGGQACGADGRGEGVDTWAFHETVALHMTAEGGRREGERGREAMLPGDDDRHLLLRVCVAQSPAVSSPPPRRHAPVLQETDAVASAERVTAPPDEVIGSATVHLGRYLATADRDGARNCTFSRPIRVSVFNPEGLAIGWIELGVCGSG